jgi:hypothetical protein
MLQNPIATGRIQFGHAFELLFGPGMLCGSLCCKCGVLTRSYLAGRTNRRDCSACFSAQSAPASSAATRGVLLSDGSPRIYAWSSFFSKNEKEDL